MKKYILLSVASIFTCTPLLGYGQIENSSSDQVSSSTVQPSSSAIQQLPPLPTPLPPPDVSSYVSTQPNNQTQSISNTQQPQN
jgi:hypothetical protein